MSGRRDAKVVARPIPDLVEVGAGAIAVATHPDRLIAPALGSCVCVALWDPAHQRGALAHVMLPSPSGSAVAPDSGRFASWAIPELVRRLVEAGSLKRSLQAKIAGGAAMFRNDEAVVRIGERNIDEVRRQLAIVRIPIRGEDVGGGHARTCELLLDSGVLLVRSYKFETRVL